MASRARQAPTPTNLQLSTYQRRVLAVPEDCDLFLGGGRGSAKSYCLALLALRHAEQYKADSRQLYVRRTHRGCADFAEICLQLFTTVYGKALRWNANEGVFRFPNGATLEINQLEVPNDYAKFQGRSFTLILIDEATQHAQPDLLDKLRSNLRGPIGMPLRMALAANPGDLGHMWCAKRYVFRGAPWTVFIEEAAGRKFVYAPGTFMDNPFVDREAYRAQLQASCPGDPDLLRAWLEGDWAINRGGYFAGCLDEKRNAVETWTEVPSTFGQRWETYLAHDFGSSAPSATYIMAVSPGASVKGRFYPRDSIVAIDELATNVPGDLNRGMAYTTPVLSEHVIDMCKRWGVKPKGVADDAIFARTGSGAGSISEEFARAGVSFEPARKGDRITGWNVMRRMLEDAGKPDVPGLYIARHCSYFWETVPYLPRDPRRLEDCASTGVPDHGADAIRMGCLRVRREALYGSFPMFP